MTDYSKTTDFTGKNTLPDTSPDKVISGVDFDLEFNAVAAASASKLDKTGGTISGTLGVTGDTTVSNIEATGVITADLGLVGAPSIDFGSTTGFYTPGNQTVGVTNAGTLTATFNNDGTISTYPSGSPEEVALKSYVDARTPIARMKLAISAANQITILSDVGVTSVLRLLDDSGTDYYYQVTLDTALVGNDWTYAADAVRSDVAITSVFYPNLSISGTRGASGQFEFKIYNSATGTIYKDQNRTVDVTIWSIP